MLKVYESKLVRMRYLFTQKSFSWRGGLHIKNDQAQDVFHVERWGASRQFTLRDVSGNEVASVRQKSLAWTPTFEIHRSEHLYATIGRKLFPLFKNIFAIDEHGSGFLTAEGDFWYRDFIFRRGGSVIAVASREKYSVPPKVSLDIVGQVDHVLILASALVVYTYRE